MSDEVPDDPEVATSDRVSSVYEGTDMPLDFSTPEYARGQRAYDGYAKATGGKTYDGRDMPEWRDLGERVQRAWISAAAAVVEFLRTGKERP